MLFGVLKPVKIKQHLKLLMDGKVKMRIHHLTCSNKNCKVKSNGGPNSFKKVDL